MTSTFYQRLLNAEDSLLSVISTGPDALRAFDLSWSTLCNSLETALEDGILDDETQQLAHQVVSRVEILAGGFINIQNEVDQWHLEVEEMMADISLDDDLMPPVDTLTLGAQNWLVKNLHNPYPSREQKIAISQTTSSSIKDVDSWFINARRQIGWTKLCTQRFGNKRAAIVAAATKFFLSSKDCNDHEVAFESSFLQIQTSALELGSNSSATAHSPSPQRPPFLESGAYPSPCSSPGQSRHSSPSLPYNPKSFKRRVSTDLDSFPESTRSRKRHRLEDASSSKQSTVIHLPSPTASPYMPESTSIRKRSNDSTCDISSAQCLKRKALPENNLSDVASKKSRTDSLERLSKEIPVADEFISYFSLDGANTLHLSDAFPSPPSMMSINEAENVDLNCYQYSFPSSILELGFDQSSSDLSGVQVSGIASSELLSPLPPCNTGNDADFLFDLDASYDLETFAPVLFDFDSFLNPMPNYSVSSLSVSSCTPKFNPNWIHIIDNNCPQRIVY